MPDPSEFGPLRAEPILLAHPDVLPDRLTMFHRRAAHDGPAPVPCAATHLLTTGEAEHDEFFGIRRAAGDAESLWHAAFARVIEAVVAHTPSHQHEVLHAAVSTAFPALRWPLAQPPDRRQWTGLDYWVRGHQLFAVLTQAATVSMRHACTRARRGDMTAAVAGLETTAAVFGCSAAALRLTAGFGADEYRTLVRPLMEPPRVTAGFSGILSVDHRALVSALRKWQGYSEIREMSGGAALMRDALAAVYAAHVGVCERFVGEQAPSLRTAATGQQSAAVRVLRALGQRRLGSVDGSAE
ncbi:hypothetical protein [Nocardia sp. CS682]|uniref:hypothetical protein n=1 Tax=Nocardia sp. CS682 TaxID=1047172 RepID=UPI0010758305|nr:hypothetical protein [Nocardia sp. CS682]QBS40323.1 hypothetical protein DMB37_09565 [Nocardia sp. CS682]